MSIKSDSFVIYLALVFLGGGLGALARAGLAALVGRAPGLEGSFPYGTFAVNLCGCLMIGLLWGISESYHVSTAARTLLFTGFLGAFTTFSTFGLESTRLLVNGESRVALLYILLSNGLGLGLVFCGHYLAELIGARRT